MVIQESADPALFRFISDRNLLQQYDLLESEVHVSSHTNQSGISHDLMKKLQRTVTNHLCDNPGHYRQCWIGITNSNHQPPDHVLVQDLQDKLVQYIASSWNTRSALHLAAVALWQINWTHPFEEGNGRTARAVAYYIMCLKYGMWLPGKNIIPQQIRANRAPYYASLHAADVAHAAGKDDVSKLEDYLSGLLGKQLIP